MSHEHLVKCDGEARPKTEQSEDCESYGRIQLGAQKIPSWELSVIFSAKNYNYRADNCQQRTDYKHRKNYLFILT